MYEASDQRSLKNETIQKDNELLVFALKVYTDMHCAFTVDGCSTDPDLSATSSSYTRLRTQTCQLTALVTLVIKVVQIYVRSQREVAPLGEILVAVGCGCIDFAHDP